MPRFLRAFAARFLIALVAGTLLAGASIKVAYRYAESKFNETAVVKFPGRLLHDVGKADDPGKPGNFLIVGSDSRSFVKSAIDKAHFGDSTSQTGTRSDTIMIAHIDPRTKQSSLVSFPRDTFVDIPGCGTQKINAAFNSDLKCGTRHGGPELLVDTIQRNFQVPINHYLEVDFVGFRQIVDTIGHVDLYFPAPARDIKSGLFIARGGCNQLDGIMALNYVRSRYYQWQDYATGRWRDDPTSDFGRIRRQQYFIRTLMQRAIDRGARSLFTARNLLERMVPMFVRDQEFKFDDALRLASSFRSLEPGKVLMLTVPTHREFRGGQDGLALDQPGAEQVFASIRGFAVPGKPLPAFKASNISVDVLNGSGRNGAASGASTAFSKIGFKTGSTGDADRSDYAVTEIRVSAKNAALGAFVKLYLAGAGKVVVVADSAAAGHGDVVVVLGRDFTGVTKPVTPTTVRGTPSTTTTTAPTTTTVLPPNPGNPPPGTVVQGGHQIVGCA